MGINEKVRCLLCEKETGYSKEFSQLNNSHLEYKHNISVEEYKKVFPEAKLYGNDFSMKTSKNAKRTHELHPELAKNNVKYLKEGQRRWLDAGNRPTDFHKENCNCISCRAKRGEDLSELHKPNCNCPICMLKRGEDISKKYPNSCGDGNRFKKWRKDNPEKAKKVYSDTMIKLHKDRPEIFIEASSKNSERLKKLHKEEKENDPIKFYNRYKEMSRQAMKNPEHGRKGGINCHILHPNQGYENAEKSIKTRKENRAYFWNNIGFLSKEELVCAKLLLKEPIDGFNCNIKIGSRTIDFLPQKDDNCFIGCFVEYHPCPCYFDKRTPEQYYQERKQIIDKSKYKGAKLVVIKNLKDARELIK